ncbi:protein of unknown function [Actinokineospora alba]|uniref:DUF4185 domain-containing protein n=1 Tax=Actinokineospora alba TaxID=504798 RepID=A0A1H0S0H2_9PSEU|nr:DUF4185 domain-containing protein [Actinokineospora alba]TDP66822.1 uncharacterized protein DUF4185 [Actinokineospora alba]SDI48752.1 protein of unknown function [Actinokineospora alba]SDP35322.1 protein of unknown function [Actinokineospora alba]
MIQVGETTLVSQITGHESTNLTAERYGIHATDLGIMWDDSAGRTFVVFGDTYGPGWRGDGAGTDDDTDWRCNVLAIVAERDLDHGLKIESVVAQDDGMARQIIDRDAESVEETVIPCAGIEIDGVHYLHYMSVRNWGPQGKWVTNYAGIAFSRDGGRTWDKPWRSRWINRAEHDHPFQMGAFAQQGEHLYLLGTPNGRWGDTHLARVSTKDILEPAAYEYWTGETWHPKDPFAAKPVFTGPVAELSVLYSTHFNRWIALHLDESKAAIVLRTAEELTGPWTDGQVVADGDRYPGLYGGFLHPESAKGPVLYYAMSRWSPYNVYLMRTTLT